MRSVPGLLVAAPVLASLALVSSPQVRAADPASSGSEKVLKKAGLATDGPSLLAFFRQRILTGNYQERIDELTRRLGDESFKVRKQAAKDPMADNQNARASRRPGERVVRRRGQSE